MLAEGESDGFVEGPVRTFAIVVEVGLCMRLVEEAVLLFRIGFPFELFGLGATLFRHEAGDFRRGLARQ